MKQLLRLESLTGLQIKVSVDDAGEKLEFDQQTIELPKAEPVAATSEAESD